MHAKKTRHVVVSGFTLVELTIVLIIVSLLIGGMFVSLSANRDLASEKETQKQLAGINDALLGFAAANGRLPCPATATSAGREAFCTEGDSTKPCGLPLVTVQAHGRCVSFFSGWVPAASLGLSPTDSQGFAVDAWSNRLRYAVTNNPDTSYPFTTPPTLIAGIKGVWASNPGALSPDLRVCNTAANIAAGDCQDSERMTGSAVAVIFSTGKNGGNAPVAANVDELANWTSSNDRVFVSAMPSPTFDDLVVWLSPNILYNRMISAGRLP